MSGTETPVIPEPTPEQIAGLQGAQVVLDPASKAAQGARGVHDLLDHNIAHRDTGYVEMGLDPADPNGDVLDPDPPVTPPATQAAKAPAPAAAATPAPKPATRA